MRGPLAAVVMIAACGPRPTAAIGNRAEAAAAAPVTLRHRAPRVPVALPARDAGRFFALAGPPPTGTCLHALYLAWRRGPESLIVHAAQLADPCARRAEPIVARLALTLDRDDATTPGLAAAAWNAVARLALTPARRRIALRNAAEAVWRAARDSRSPTAWRDVARAFAAAATAGDRDAIAGELDAWHNALAAETLGCAAGTDPGPLSVVPAAHARAATLGPGAAGDRLRVEVAAVRCPR
jgi:hypothetical protein